MSSCSEWAPWSWAAMEKLHNTVDNKQIVIQVGEDWRYLGLVFVCSFFKGLVYIKTTRSKDAIKYFGWKFL